MAVRNFGFIVLLVFVFVVRQSNAQSLTEEINSTLNSARGITLSGIKIINADNGEVIYTRNSDEPIIPASTIKLFTTSAALIQLGKEFHLTTQLLTEDKDISDGVINGGLIIKGFANPFFTSRQLDSMVLGLKKLGINSIKGNIIGDDSFFDTRYNRESWIKRERTDSPLPPVSALIIDRNEVTLSFIPTGKSSKPFNIKVAPFSNLYEINYSAKLTRRRRLPTILINTASGKIKINVKGHIRKRRHPYSYKAFIDKPALFAADLLFDRLKQNGISVDGSPKQTKVKKKLFLLNENFTTLEDVIKKADKESDNFLAEIIFKTLGAQYSREVGNSFYATQAIYSFLEKIGINTDNIDIVDGSGLSRSNRVTAEAVAELLEYIYHNRKIFNTFYSSLSSAGEDGTLESRLVGFGLKGNFHGKTGTLNGVSAVSGYLTTNSGKNVIVSILINFNRGGADYFRELQDEIIIDVAKKY
jgi:D-alanyl-D-alanine carboxypeptidase/D-alanyl-D-alanine-endopeptidase (penicillin-binding protein 4)